MGIVDEIRLSFKNGSYLTKLIHINVAVWLVIRIIFVGYKLSGSDELSILNWLALPASFETFLSRPWTIVTYMFLHFDFFHILFNSLWLYWFGKIFLEYHNPQRLLSLYLLGGFLGGIFFMLAYNFFPLFRESVENTQLLGASASVIAIVIAISVYVPNHLIHLLFLGPVKIKWISIVSILIYIVGLSGENAGGNFAHLGGALWGWIYMSRLMAGHDISAGFNQFVDRLFIWRRPRRHLKVKYSNSANPDYDYNRSKSQQQEEVNRILDKISKSGYDSLTSDEKEMLFKMGSKK